MDRKDNLVNIDDQPKEKAHQIRSMGGLARAKKIRERKTLAEDLKRLLNTKRKGEKLTHQENIVVALIEKASNGDTKAFELIRDSIGEKPKDVVEVGDVNIKFEWTDEDES